MLSAKFHCGVIEGFYGRPWVPAQRDRLLGWMQGWGLNSYLYAPKDDIKHRAIWRELYDANELSALNSLVEGCRRRNIEFVYALAPGLDVRFSRELDAVKRKLGQIARLGVKTFALLFDDLPESLHPEDRRRFGTFAGAQAALTNAINTWLKALLPGAELWFCPTVYCGRFADMRVPDNAYLRELGGALDASIEILWTGPEIVPENIPVASIRELAGVIKRRPLIWENYHANDYDISRLYLGPFTDRPAALRNEVTGILSNPNCQLEANFIPLHTLATYAREKRWNVGSALAAAKRDWLAHFRTRTGQPFTAVDLDLLVDLLHVPFWPGKSALRFLADAEFLVDHDISEWGSRHHRFERMHDRIVSLVVKVTELEDRDLCFTLLDYVKEVDREARLLHQFLAWRKAGRTRGGFVSPAIFRPSVYRGGTGAALRRLLRMDARGVFTRRPDRSA